MLNKWTLWSIFSRASKASSWFVYWMKAKPLELPVDLSLTSFTIIGNICFRIKHSMCSRICLGCYLLLFRQSWRILFLNCFHEWCMVNLQFGTQNLKLEPKKNVLGGKCKTEAIESWWKWKSYSIISWCFRFKTSYIL